MYVSAIDKCSICNGEGFRVVIWVSGCTHHCPNCHNPETWSFKKGKFFNDSIRADIKEYLNKPYIKGVTFSGGDPLSLQNRTEVLEFARFLKENFPDKDIWCYTGYTFEELPKSLLEYFDVLVDGKFENDKRDVSLAFRGSSNQRIINIPKTLKVGKVVEWENNNVG